MPTLRLVLAAASIALLAGCSAPVAPGSSSGAGSDTGDGGTSPSQAASAPAASAPSGSGPDACDLVPASALQAAYGVDPGTGTSSPGNVGGSECDYSGALGAVVQVTPSADSYMPASFYSPDAVSGAVAPTSGDRGYVAPGAVAVIVGQTGVFVTVSAPGTTIDQGQTLAAAIAGGL